MSRNVSRVGLSILLIEDGRVERRKRLLGATRIEDRTDIVWSFGKDSICLTGGKPVIAGVRAGEKGRGWKKRRQVVHDY